MQTSTATTIIEAAIPLLAQHGYAGTSMRDVAKAAGIKPSVIYHYFPDKAALMRGMRMHTTRLLDAEIRALPPTKNASELLRQRIRYQFERIELIVALLQYFMAAKYDFPQIGQGFVPPRAYQHMRDIIEQGIAEGRYASADVDFDAKTITHLINGFLLEFYPHDLTEADIAKLTDQLATFIERSLRA